LEVTRDGTGRGTIAPGQLVGEMAFFSGKPRSATVRSVAGGEVLALKAADFRRFASDHPSVILQMARVLVDRLS
jgi:NTE family protein